MKIKKPHVAVRVLLGILSVILCIALFAATIATMVIADFRVMTNKDNLQTFISQLLFASPQKNGPVILHQAMGAGGLRLDDTAPSGTSQLVVDYLYGYLENQLGGEIPVSKEEVQDLLEQSTVPEFLSDKMASLVSDIYTGENTTTITADEVQTLIEENKALIETVVGAEITTEQIDKIVEEVEKADVVETVKEVVEVQLGLKPDPENPDAPTEAVDESTGDASAARPPLKENIIQSVLDGNATVEDVINGGIPTMLAAIREITSMTVLLSLLGTCAVLIGLLFLANYWKPHAAVRCAGITIMLAGLPFFAMTVAVLAVPALFADPVLSVVALIIQLTSGVSIGVFAGGVVLLVGSIVWGCLRAKKLREMEAVPAVTAEAPAPAEEPQEM